MTGCVTRVINLIRRYREWRQWSAEGTYRQQLKAFERAEMIGGPTTPPRQAEFLNLKLVRSASKRVA